MYQFNPFYDYPVVDAIHFGIIEVILGFIVCVLQVVAMMPGCWTLIGCLGLKMIPGAVML